VNRNRLLSRLSSRLLLDFLLDQGGTRGSFSADPDRERGRVLDFKRIRLLSAGTLVVPLSVERRELTVDFVSFIPFPARLPGHTPRDIRMRVDDNNSHSRSCAHQLKSSIKCSGNTQKVTYLNEVLNIFGRFKVIKYSEQK